MLSRRAQQYNMMHHHQGPTESVSFWAQPSQPELRYQSRIDNSPILVEQSEIKAQMQKKAAAASSMVAGIHRMTLQQTDTVKQRHQYKPQQQQQQHRQPRPRMGVSNMRATSSNSSVAVKSVGVPILTSTPNTPTKSKGKSGDGDDSDEPIYCEIPTTPGNKKSPDKRGKSSKHRQQGFLASSDYSPIDLKQRHGLVDRDPMAGLGRRALTQVDMDLGSRKISSDSKPALPMRPHAMLMRQSNDSGGSEFSSKKPVNKRHGFVSDSDFSRHPEATRTIVRKARNHHQRHQPVDTCSDFATTGQLDETTSASEIASTVVSAAGTADVGGPDSTDLSTANVIKRGLLWQQRDKMFSRWKERFFILTKDYLQCFKKSTSRITEMGGFVFKLRLNDVENVELMDKKGYLTVVLTLAREGNGKIFLRKPEGIREWFQMLKETVDKCKEKKGLMKSTKEFWSKKQFTDSSSMEQWLLARKRIETKYLYNSPMETHSAVEYGNNGPANNSRHQRARELSRSNLNMALRNPVTTTDYGFIDAPLATGFDLQSNYELEDRSRVSPISSEFALKKMVRDTSSTFSHDSGVDSMNTNSSGSVLSRQTPLSSFESRPQRQSAKSTTSSSVACSSRISTTSKRGTSTTSDLKPSKFVSQV